MESDDVASEMLVSRRKVDESMLGCNQLRLKSAPKHQLDEIVVKLPLSNVFVLDSGSCLYMFT
jgi:hypothetical protein